MYIHSLKGESVGNRDAVVGKRGLENLPPVPGGVAGLPGGIKSIEGRNVKGGELLYIYIYIYVYIYYICMYMYVYICM
jgi:hypothetical protein